ncbi:hypothetical protein ACP70R_008167 [Stipagrostis hirtigluma subsp. patula]
MGSGMAAAPLGRGRPLRPRRAMGKARFLHAVELPASLACSWECNSPGGPARPTCCASRRRRPLDVRSFPAKESYAIGGLDPFVH